MIRSMKLGWRSYVARVQIPYVCTCIWGTVFSLKLFYFKNNQWTQSIVSCGFVRNGRIKICTAFWKAFLGVKTIFTISQLFIILIWLIQRLKYLDFHYKIFSLNNCSPCLDFQIVFTLSYIHVTDLLRLSDILYGLQVNVFSERREAGWWLLRFWR